VVKASTSPLKEQYSPPDTNVFQLSQPEIFADPLTEVLRNGARALLAQAVAGFGGYRGTADIDKAAPIGLDYVVRRMGLRLTRTRPTGRSDTSVVGGKPEVLFRGRQDRF
jgi:hypothetical protein